MIAWSPRARGRSKPKSKRALICGLIGIGLAVGCGAGDGTGGDPTEVILGETTFVVVVNPVVNDVTDAVVPEPGTARSDVLVEADGGGPRVHSDADGIAVLSPVAAGSRTLSLSDRGIGGSLMEGIADMDLVELAIAGEGDRVERMARVVYAFGAEVVELTANTPISAVNDALANSNRIVLLEGGTYEGDLEFSGSDVTLLQSAFCGPVDVGGSDIVALGNMGMAHVATPEDCPYVTLTEAFHRCCKCS